MKRHVTAGVLTLVLATTGACETSPPQEIHPTHAGPNGECIEWDDEPCDADPFDIDDDDVVVVPVPVVPKPTAKAPVIKKPATTRRR